MASKPKESQSAPQRKPRKAVQVAPGRTTEETEQNIAAFVTSPELAAYRVINGADAKVLGDLIDVPELMAELRRHAEAVNRGDLAHTEAMLINQATALQSLFARLAERGMSCTDAGQFELNMRMALRAQSQCRATLETLAAVKNPQTIAFVRQANIAAGPQQVNNGIAAPSRAGENEIEQSKLAGNGNELLPDTGASSLGSRNNPPFAAVGKINRPKNGRG